MGLSGGESISMCLAVLTQYPSVTDKQTEYCACNHKRMDMS